MTETNVSATRLLFEVASEAQVSFFLHLSSVGVVGRVRHRIVDESSACNPMNRYEETKLAAERIVSSGLDSGKVVILRPTIIFGAQTLEPWVRSTLQSRIRLALRGNENTHLVYIEDVVAAAMFLWQKKIEKPVETFNVSSDEEDGGTYREVHTLLASMIEGAAHSFKRSAPLFIPHGLRLIRRGSSNYGDVIYSSHKLRQAGFNFPFGRRAGLVRVASILRDRVPHMNAAVL
jgi:nucleoside-diphosphate-sugar epimerase